MGQKSYKRIILYHVTVLGILLFLILVYRCPIYYFFHIPCPGCGITRAYLAVLSLDIDGAFHYHPLFFTVGPTILYVAHRNVMKKKFSYKVEKIYLAVLCVLFLIVYIIRICQR